MGVSWEWGRCVCVGWTGSQEEGEGKGKEPEKCILDVNQILY